MLEHVASATSSAGTRSTPSRRTASSVPSSDHLVHLGDRHVEPLGHVRQGRATRPARPGWSSQIHSGSTMPDPEPGPRKAREHSEVVVSTFRTSAVSADRVARSVRYDWGPASAYPGPHRRALSGVDDLAIRAPGWALRPRAVRRSAGMLASTCRAPHPLGRWIVGSGSASGGRAGRGSVTASRPPARLSGARPGDPPRRSTLRPRSPCRRLTAIDLVPPCRPPRHALAGGAAHAKKPRQPRRPDDRARSRRSDTPARATANPRSGGFAHPLESPTPSPTGHRRLRDRRRICHPTGQLQRPTAVVIARP